MGFSPSVSGSKEGAASAAEGILSTILDFRSPHTYLYFLRTTLTTDWCAYAWSAYISSRVEHGSFLALRTSNTASLPDHSFSRLCVSICHGPAGWQPICGGNTCLYDWWAAADELDGRTRPSEHDGPTRHQGP